MHPGHEVLARWRRRAFQLGQADCALFAADVIATVAGRQEIAALAERLAGTYSTDIADAWVAIEQLLAENGAARGPGQHPLEALCRHLFGEPVAPLQARRWDVVLGDWGAGTSLGICDGHRIVAVGEDGLVWFPLHKASAAWRVTAEPCHG